MRFACVFAVAVTGCTLISGVDDFQFGAASAAGSAGTGAAPTGGRGSGASGVGGTAAAGGGADCDLATQKQCGDACVALVNPDFGCDETGCVACAEGSSCCPDCVNTSSNPKRCGSCNGACDADEWCLESMCRCRPGLVLSGQSCIDPATNAAACGGREPCAGATPLCQQGECVATCTGKFTQCGTGCVDQSTDALHCGSCQGCDLDKVCIGGDCKEYQAAVGCDACPCSACQGDFDLCCDFPGSTKPVCVTHDARNCP